MEDKRIAEIKSIIRGNLIFPDPDAKIIVGAMEKCVAKTATDDDKKYYRDFIYRALEHRSPTYVGYDTKLKDLFKSCLDDTPTVSVAKGGYDDNDNDNYEQKYHEIKDKYIHERNDLFSFLGMKL